MPSGFETNNEAVLASSFRTEVTCLSLPNPDTVVLTNDSPFQCTKTWDFGNQATAVSDFHRRGQAASESSTAVVASATRFGIDESQGT